MSMTQTPDPEAIQQYWQRAIDQMNDQWADAFQQNVDAQTRFVEAWLDAIDQSTSEETIEEAVEGYRQAYETWMDAAEESIRRMADAAEGEEVSVEEFRDSWLNAANQSFKQIMSTSAFAAMTGESVEDSLDFRRQLDDAAEVALHDMGLPTKGDIKEVGDRMVELERRQHAVEEKLDRVLEAIGEE